MMGKAARVGFEALSVENDINVVLQGYYNTCSPFF